MSRIESKIIDRLVFNLRKPARYTGCELNSIRKDNAFIKMAICYPDLYEVGMSNNGIRILYDIANRENDVSCERVFAVPNDFEEKIRVTKMPLFTLESYTPLCELDLLGFNVAYELLYTNILQVLDLGQIPLFSKDREKSHPIVIGGGESVSNPMPIKDFFDAFFIGDGEEGISDILKAIRISKLESLPRPETIELLSQIDGVYAPSLGKKTVRKRIVKSWMFQSPLHPVIPNLKITQERLVVEITRGCKNLCNFCHAGYYELPYRYGQPEILGDQILRLITNVYYTDLTLSSLSISDYRHLIALFNRILPALIEKGISISLPSLRVDKRTLPVIEQISDLRKTSLTFAVESGCDEIRNMANKQLKTDDILSIADYVFGKGWNLLKLYFMIGLPGCESYDEAGSIIELLKKIYMTGGRKRDLNVTISPFVPKPHTPFEREKQMGTEYLIDSINKIKRGLPGKIAIKAHDVNASLLEGVMSRGDPELSQVIYNSYTEGARLDSWKENFRFDIWKNNLNKIEDWERYLKQRDKNEILPWSFITTGFEKLVESRKDKISADYRNIQERPPFDKLDNTAIEESLNRFRRKYEVKKRVRIRLSKKANAKYISHLDFMAIIIRALRLAELPVSFTQGFNKRERVSFGFPLPVGIESVYELCDIDLFEDADITTLTSRLSAKLPEGIEAIDAVYLNSKKSIMSVTSAAMFSIEINDDLLYKKFVKNLDLKINFIKETERGNKIIGFSDAVIEYDIQEKNKYTIFIKLKIGDEKSVRVDVCALALSEAGYDDFYKFKVVRLCQYRIDNGDLKEIFEAENNSGG